MQHELNKQVKAEVDANTMMVNAFTQQKVSRIEQVITNQMDIEQAQAERMVSEMIASADS